MALVSAFSCRLLMFAGRLNNTQWTQVPIGASGSSTISARDFVPAGGSFQERPGEMFLPMQEYLAGMDCPFANASLVKLRDMVASVEGISFAVDGDSDVAGAEDVQDASVMEINIKLIRRIRLI